MCSYVPVGTAGSSTILVMFQNLVNPIKISFAHKGPDFHWKQCQKGAFSGLLGRKKRRRRDREIGQRSMHGWWVKCYMAEGRCLTSSTLPLLNVTMPSHLEKNCWSVDEGRGSGLLATWAFPMKEWGATGPSLGRWGQRWNADEKAREAAVRNSRTVSASPVNWGEEFILKAQEVKDGP